LKLKALFLSLFIVFGSGCSPTNIATLGVPVAGATYYITGELQASYPVSIYHLYEVVLYNFEQEGTELISVENAKDHTRIVGELYDGESITVNISYNDKSEAVLGIRIGIFGAEERSRHLIKRMEEYI